MPKLEHIVTLYFPLNSIWNSYFIMNSCFMINYISKNIEEADEDFRV